MADFKLVVRADIAPSVDLFRKDLEEVKRQLDQNPLRVKLMPDEKQDGKAFQQQVSAMLSSISAAAKESTAPLIEIKKLISEISAKDFSINFNADGSRAEVLGEYVSKVREYASELQRIMGELPKVLGSEQWKLGVGSSFNNQVIELYKFFDQYGAAVEGFQKRLNSVSSMSGAERIAKEAQAIWDALAPFINKASELGALQGNIMEFPVKPEGLERAAAGANQYADAMNALRKALGVEQQTVADTNATYAEHAAAVEKAAATEQEKQSASDTLANALEKEAGALETVEGAAKAEASVQSEVADTIRETGNAAKDAADKTEQAAETEESSFYAARKAVQEYYSLLNEARKTERQGFEIGKYEELNRQLATAEQKYLALTSAEERAKMSEAEQASLLDLIAQKQKDVARATEAAAIKAEQAAQKEVMSARDQYDALQQIQVIRNSINSATLSANNVSSNKTVSEDVERLKALSGELDRVQTKVKSGEYTNQEYADSFQSLRATITATIGALRNHVREAERGAEGSKTRAEAERAYADAINKAERALKNWSRAEHSKNAESRQAYKDIQDNRDALNKLKQGYDNGAASANDLKAASDRLNQSVREGEGPIVRAGDNVKTLGERFKEGVAKFSSWLSVSRAVMAVIRSIRQMVSASVELDSAMTQMQVVTNASTSAMNDFADAASEAAQRVGSSITDFVSSATTFARLGYSTNESSTLAEYTAMLQNVGDIDVADAQNAITAIVKAYGVGVDQIESIMDKLVTVGNNFPISVSQIAEGMNNASSSLAAAGNSFEESVALLTAANTTVQNAAKASTGLRTIAARIRNTKTELDELGETMEEAKYEELVKGLTDAGVTLKDVNGEFRSTYDIISDIAKVWDNMTSMEQAGLATALSGTRQQAIFYSLIDQFKEASDAMDAMANSAGALDQAYATFMESIQAHINQFKAAFQSVASGAFTRDFINDIVDLGTKSLGAIDGLTKLINTLGGLEGILRTLGAALIAANLSKLITQFKVFGGQGVASINKLRTALSDFHSEFMRSYTAWISGSMSFGQSLKSLVTSAAGAKVALSAFTIAITAVVFAYSKYKQAQEEARRARKEEYDTFKENEKAAEDYAKRIAELKEKLADGTTSQEEATKARKELLDIREELLQFYGKEAQAIDTVGDSAETTAEKIRGLNDAILAEQAQSHLTTNSRAYNKAVSKIEGLDSTSVALNIGTRSEVLDAVAQLLEGYDFASLETLRERKNGYDVVTGYRIQIDSDDAFDAQEKVKALNLALAQLGDTLRRRGIENDLEKVSASAIKSIDKVINKYKEDYDQFVRYSLAAGTDEAANDAYERLLLLSDEYAEVSADATKTDEERREAIQGIVDALGEISLDGVDSEAVRKYLQVMLDDLLQLGNTELEIKPSSDTVAQVKTLAQALGEVESKVNAINPGNGNVNLFARNKVTVTNDNLKAAQDIMPDAKVGDYMTVASQTFRDGNAAIVVTPILPNGELLSQKELEAYIEEITSGVKDGNYAANDRLGILMGVFDEGNWQDSLRAADAFAQSIHDLNDETIQLLENMVEVTGSPERAMKAMTDEINGTIDSLKSERKVVEDTLKTLGEGAPTAYADELKARINEIDDEIAENQEWLKVYPGLFRLIEEAVNQTTQSTFTKLSDFKTAISTLSAAFGSLSEKDAQHVSYSSLESIGSQFADSVDDIDAYLKRLVQAGTDTKKVSDILNELAEAKAVNAAQSALLAGADEDLIKVMLKEAGVANSDQAAIDTIAVAKGKLQMASINSADGMIKFINSLNDEGQYSEYARSALVQLAAQMVLTDSTGMSFKQQIAALNELGNAMGYPIAQAQRLAAVLAGQEAANAPVTLDENGNISIEDQKAMIRAKKKAVNVTEQSVLNAYAEVFQKFKPSLNYDFSGGYTGPTGGGGGGSSVEEYTAEIDKYYDAMKRLEEIQERMTEIESKADTADSYEEKIFYTKALISCYDDQAEATQRLIDLRKESIKAGVEELRQLGFQVEYNEEANRFIVQNMGHLNELSAGSTEATNQLRQDTEKLIGTLDDLNSANQDSADSMRQMAQEMKQARKAVFDYLKAIVDESSGVIDTIQKISDVLHNAADEFASSGFITIDTFQEIVSLGAEYMAYLQDENGMLVINEENINRVLAAKTQELAVNEALAYVERIRMALEAGSVEELNQLLYATLETTDATWGLVYANLALLDLDSDQYQAALNNINAIRALADSAVSSIGRTVGELRKNETEALERMKSGVDDILKYVMDMLKHRIQEQIDALNEMKEAYADLIAMRKESIKTAKEETDYQTALAEKVKEIGQLQARINALALDNSRSAVAERLKLEEELAKLQGDLADQQAEHSIEAQENALDTMQKAYEEQKDEEIKVLEDSISSYQKLYDMAIDYIENNWHTLYQDLISWNSEYGSVLNSELTDAWNAALEAAQRYGSYVNALGSIDADLEAARNASGGSTIGMSTSGGDYANEDMIRAIVKQMKQNSEAWRSANSDKRSQLASANQELGARLRQYIPGLTYDPHTGTWYIDPSKTVRLYDRYHSGGIVGTAPTLQQDETIAVLQRGEAVLTKGQQNTLFKILDFANLLTNRFGTMLADMDLRGQLRGGSTSYPSIGAGGGVVIDHVEISAPVQVLQRLDREELQRCSELIGEFSSNYIREGFTKRGLRPAAGLF